MKRNLLYLLDNLTILPPYSYVSTLWPTVCPAPTILSFIHQKLENELKFQPVRRKTFLAPLLVLFPVVPVPSWRDCSWRRLFMLFSKDFLWYIIVCYLSLIICYPRISTMTTEEGLVSRSSKSTERLTIHVSTSTCCGKLFQDVLLLVMLHLFNFVSLWLLACLKHLMV